MMNGHITAWFDKYLDQKGVFGQNIKANKN